MIRTVVVVGGALNRARRKNKLAAKAIFRLLVAIRGILWLFFDEKSLEDGGDGDKDGCYGQKWPCMQQTPWFLAFGREGGKRRIA